MFTRRGVVDSGDDCLDALAVDNIEQPSGRASRFPVTLLPLGNRGSAYVEQRREDRLAHACGGTDAPDVLGREGSAWRQAQHVHLPQGDGVHGADLVQVVRHLVGHLQDLAHGCSHSRSKTLPLDIRSATCLSVAAMKASALVLRASCSFAVMFDRVFFGKP